MARALVVLLLLLLLAAGGLAGWGWHALHQPGPELGGAVVVSVERGEPFRRTVEKLASAGIVRWPLLVRAYARFDGSDRLIQAGDYRFDRPATPLEVLATLRSAAMVLARITFPEGLTLRQMAAQLEATGFGGADEYLCAAQDPAFLAEMDAPASGLEGFLFPDTYSFAVGAAPRDVLRAMVRRFRERIATVVGEGEGYLGRHSDLVTLASIVEKETGIADERGLVAGVFRNRMRIGMRLQSDPTAVYGWKEGVVTAADLKVDSPYNTYLYGGLPPGPICNPGLAALQAALHPTDSDYLYFVARGDGTHAFSANLEAHNRAVAAARREAR